MVKVKAFSLSPLTLWFWSHDHDPPHFHAKKNGEWEYRVNFLEPASEMLVLKWSVKKPDAKTRKKLTQLAEQHRDALLQEWEDIRRNQI